MALSPDERRFIKNWQEQRKDGKASYVGVYTFGLFILFYMAFLAAGLFGGWPFLKVSWLVNMGIAALVSAFLLSQLLWRMHQKRFSRIIQREMAEGEEKALNQ
jgi:uncharacterized membrane protein (DUF485 family)